MLVRVADIVTQRLSLDHQLPRLIELILEALDAERAPKPRPASNSHTRQSPGGGS